MIFRRNMIKLMTRNYDEEIYQKPSSKVKSATDSVGCSLSPLLSSFSIFAFTFRVHTFRVPVRPSDGARGRVPCDGPSYRVRYGVGTSRPPAAGSPSPRGESCEWHARNRGCRRVNVSTAPDRSAPSGSKSPDDLHRTTFVAPVTVPAGSMLRAHRTNRVFL